jgi:hypothetical protein
MAAGGISCTSPRSNLDFTVIDCAFDHCYGRAAGAMYGGLAIRCLFTRNWTTYCGAAMYAGRAFNCLFTHNAIYDGNKVVAAHVFVNAAAAGYEDVQTHEIKTVNLRD